MSLSSTSSTLQVIAAGVIIGWCSGVQVAWAQADTSQSSTPSQTSVVSGDLANKTDAELTELTAQWSHLSASERRELLAEVKGRMAANRSARPTVGVHVQRRYGRVVRKRDGSVVVETRVVQMRPRTSGRVTFGIGFEQRNKSRQAPPSPETAPEIQQPQTPAITVSQPPAADPSQ